MLRVHVTKFSNVSWSKLKKTPEFGPFIQKKSMFKQTYNKFGNTTMIKQPINYQAKQLYPGYPGKYKAISLPKTAKEDGTKCPEHLCNHTLVYNTERKEFTMLFTSAKGLPESTRISGEKITGSFTEMRNPNSEKAPQDDFGEILFKVKGDTTFVVDNYGNNVPDKKAGGQYIALLGFRRQLVDVNIEQLLENKKATEYCNKHMDAISAHEDKVNLDQKGIKNISVKTSAMGKGNEDE